LAPVRHLRPPHSAGRPPLSSPADSLQISFKKIRRQVDSTAEDAQAGEFNGRRSAGRPSWKL
jgi:hypothetical protein